MRKGTHFSEETKRKISETKKRLYSEGKIIPPMKGKTFIPNENQLRALREGRKLSHTEEVTAKRVKARIMKGNYKHSEEARKKMSISRKGYHYSPKTEFKKGIIPWMKGKHQSKEAIEKQRASMIKTYSTNLQLKKRISEATKKVMSNPKFRERLSEIRKRGIASGKIKVWNRGKRPSEETIRKQRETLMKRLSNPEERKKVSERSTATLLRLYETGTFPKQENTKPERQIKEELIKRGYKEGIDFIHQYKFMNKFMCDFCFPKQKVIVEAYGDFWHANPNKYPAGSTLHKHQIKGVGRDKSKEAYIRKVDNNSWIYLILWESDIKKDVAKCVDKIEQALLRIS